MHNYIQQGREISRVYNVLVMAIYQLRYDARQDDPDRLGAQFFGKVVGVEATATKAWYGYKLAFGRDLSGQLQRPTVTDLSHDLKTALYDVREATIIKYASLFESFAQCWALNYLLTALENGTGWTSDERKLAENFSPVHGKHNAPGWPVIARRIPKLTSGLTNLPHINKDSSTGVDITMPVSQNLNAFRTISFWRDFRNNIVHSSGLVTSQFFEEHNKFFEELRMPYAKVMRPLRLGRRLQLFDFVVPAMATTLYKAASWMNDWLEVYSTGKRGHPEAPNTKTTDYFVSTFLPGPLLLQGDHAESYKWQSDGAFRAQFI
jgi:hypothetical protein